MAAVAIGAAGGGDKHLAGQGLVARVADDGAHLLQAVREPAPVGVGAGAALPLVAQLRLVRALPVRLHLDFPVPLRLILPCCLLQSPFPHCKDQTYGYEIPVRLIEFNVWFVELSQINTLFCN